LGLSPVRVRCNVEANEHATRDSATQCGRGAVPSAALQLTRHPLYGPRESPLLTVFDYAGLGAAALATLERTFGAFTMLHHVLDWGRDSDPKVEVDEIVTMDEYTHDVLIPLPDRRYLAFDTT
jgi:hypothetical protein